MNKQMTINVKVQGIEQLHETVALLKELKELGAGNSDALAEIISGGSEPMKVIVEVEQEKPWYPNDMPWTEHDGKSVPYGRKFHVLLRHERETEDHDDTIVRIADGWVDEFLWNSCNEDDVVAYIKIED